MDRRALLGLAPPKAERSASLGPDYYTNAVLRTQEGKEVRFYDDLMRDRIVAINFIYTRCEGVCPMTTANLVQVRRLLGERANRDIHLYTITLKPWEDGPGDLQRYATEQHANWTFLTGDEYDLTTIRFRLFRWDHPALDFNLEQHTGMVRIINDRMDRWSMCPTLATPAQIVDAISWAEPTKPLEERRRASYGVRARRNEELRRLISA